MTGIISTENSVQVEKMKNKEFSLVYYTNNEQKEQRVEVVMSRTDNVQKE